MDGRGEELEKWTVTVDADTGPLRRELNSATNIGRRFSSSLVRAFKGLAVQGKSLGEVFRSLALDLSKMVLNAAFKPLENSLSSLFSGLLGGSSGLFGGGVGLMAGTPTPFAKGGVIAQPTLFPMAGGSGVMGERGAEAIMPLARGADGRLGVMSNGGAGAGPSVVVNIVAQDVASFRNSQSQVAAVMSRALAAGQRNL